MLQNDLVPDVNDFGAQDEEYHRAPTVYLFLRLFIDLVRESTTSSFPQEIPVVSADEFTEVATMELVTVARNLYWEEKYNKPKGKNKLSFAFFFFSLLFLSHTPPPFSFSFSLSLASSLSSHPF